MLTASAKAARSAALAPSSSLVSWRSAASASFEQELAALGSRADPDCAQVALVGFAPSEPGCFERVDQARHRRRLHLLGLRQLRERSRTAEHEHGQRRSARPRKSHLIVRAPQASQQVDRCRVQLLGDLVERCVAPLLASLLIAQK